MLFGLVNAPGIFQDLISRVAPSPSFIVVTIWKGSFRVTHDKGHQLYFYLQATRVLTELTHAE